MKVFKMRQYALGLLFALTLGLFMTSCNDDNDTRVKDAALETIETEIVAESNAIQAMEDATVTHPLIAKLKASLTREEMEGLGNLSWDLSKLVTYEGVDQPGIYVPSADNSSKVLMARYDVKADRFDNLIMEITPSEMMVQDQQNSPEEDLYFSGTLSLSAPTGQLFITKEIERGNVVNSEMADWSRHPWGSAAWRECVIDCYWANLYNLPPVASIFCAGVCAGCIPAPPSCIACAICIATHVGVCWSQCS